MLPCWLYGWARYDLVMSRRTLYDPLQPIPHPTWLASCGTSIDFRWNRGSMHLVRTCGLFFRPPGWNAWRPVSHTLGEIQMRAHVTAVVMRALGPGYESCGEEVTCRVSSDHAILEDGIFRALL